MSGKQESGFRTSDDVARLVRESENPTWSAVSAQLISAQIAEAQAKPSDNRSSEEINRDAVNGQPFPIGRNSNFIGFPSSARADFDGVLREVRRLDMSDLMRQAEAKSMSDPITAQLLEKLRANEEEIASQLIKENRRLPFEKAQPEDITPREVERIRIFSEKPGDKVAPTIEQLRTDERSMERAREAMMVKEAPQWFNARAFAHYDGVASGSDETAASYAATLEKTPAEKRTKVEREFLAAYHEYPYDPQHRAIAFRAGLDQATEQEKWQMWSHREYPDNPQLAHLAYKQYAGNLTDQEKQILWADRASKYKPEKDRWLRQETEFSNGSSSWPSRIQ